MSARVYVTHLQESKDSARGYKWDVEINFGDLPSDLINVRAQSVTQPNPDHNIIDVEIRQFTKKESGGVTWNEIDLTLAENTDYELLRAIYNLSNRQVNYKTGVQEFKGQYSPNNDGVLIMLESLDDSAPESWQLYGCLIQAYQPPEKGNDRSARDELPITVAYDYALLIA